MTHLIQLTVEKKPDWIVIKTDAKNAFNSVSRVAILTEVPNHFPEIYKFISKCYINPAPLTECRLRNSMHSIRRRSSARGSIRPFFVCSCSATHSSV